MIEKHPSYNDGCRCETCRTQHRERMRRVRAALAKRSADDIPHGTATAYANWGCRCIPCRQAATEANREAARRYRARKKQPQQ